MLAHTPSIIGVALIAMLPFWATAQERELGNVKPLGARVRVTAASQHGDTSSLSYTVDNIRVGGESFWGLLVEVSAPVVAMPQPARQNWGRHPTYRRRAIVGWMMYEDTLLRPGHSTPALTVIARGVPDVVRYWAVPDLVAHPPAIGDDAPRDDYLAESDTGFTVGAVHLPGTNPASLLARLKALSSRACGDLVWITERVVCHSLDVKMGNAVDALAAGRIESARQHLSSFVSELDAQHGSQPNKHVGDNAYALLQPNAGYILSMLR